MASAERQPAWDTTGLESPHTQEDKAARVRCMFDGIAPTYERVNRLFSGGRDAYWRRRAVELAEVGGADGVLDIACGTGDLARAMARRGPRQVIGCDFSHPMLELAAGHPSQPTVCIQADALRLPLKDESVTVVCCAFGVRNFQDLDRGLGEMNRVLADGGRAVILEFTRPANRLLRAFYELYAKRIMPVLASWISRDRDGAYRYLPRSVVSFLDAPQMCARLRSAGFAEAGATALTFGVVTVYVARKATHGQKT
ncbi:MAG: bifunctional demethylmenaquinone methyltransferase/2-methoxy-6-polyprenyl-1,4-benzoquinol methylase UbiE [bacterium]|nr:bifunctional demethylmenaquinone methyltransferase/2-methoxy-6-polyprenyl-1,4-benzoquinol methylase UbiE [bacterium]